MFRIREILSWIWILGLDPYFWLTDPNTASGTGCGSGSGSCSFRQWPSRCQQKIIFLLKFYAYSFLKLLILHSSTIKVIKKSQNRRSRFSSFFLLVDGRMWIQIWIRIRTNKLRLRIRIEEAYKHTVPTVPDADPVPEHCLNLWWVVRS